MEDHNKSNQAQCPLTQLTTGATTQFDMKLLQDKKKYGIGCHGNVCQGAKMDKTNQPAMDLHRSSEQTINEAREFLYEYYRDAHPDGLAGLPARATEVEESIVSTGTYFHTFEELQYGVRLAWRNASRCIMRIQWKNLRLIDARGLNEHAKISSQQVFDRCVEHLEEAIQDIDGNRVIHSTMTIMPQLLPGQSHGARIFNSQLIRFAGYRQSDGTILGDPANVDLTLAALKLGWSPPTKRTPFDVLPLISQGNQDDSQPCINELPHHVQVLVPLHHPDYPGLREMNLLWHAVPAISNFCLDIGGIQYPCAPFNGWYMASEIASRNLLDIQRYNLMEEIAVAMRLDRSHPMWKDRVGVELNAAVLASFQEERLTVVDHHTASDSFVRHHAKEMQTRGYIPADWVWIVPPVGGSTTSVFHQEMVNFCIKPTFLPPFESVGTLIQHDSKLPQPILRCPFAASATVSKKSTRAVHVFFGSETGTSEAFAAAIHGVFAQHGIVATCSPLNKCNLVAMSTSGPCSLVIITSTFGAGGPPANAQKFVDTLNTFNGDMSNAEVFVFGLGSSSYSTFNACAMGISRQLRRCGASVIVEGVGDDMKDMKRTFGVFFEEVLRAHDIAVPGKTRKAVEWSSTPLDQVIVDERIVKATLEAASMVVATPSDRQVIQYRFNADVSYHEGDHVAVIPQNSHDAVEAVAKVFPKIDGKQFIKVHLDVVPVHLRGGYTWNQLLRGQLDLSAAVPLALTLLAVSYAVPHSDMKIELQYYSRTPNAHTKWMEDSKTSISEFFVRFASVVQKIPLDELLPVIPRIVPRLYSISSSPKDKSSLDVTIRQTRVRTDRLGLCSAYLASLRVGATIKMYVSPCPEFRFDPSCPTIMIANGTGIAPFRSFWRASSPPDWFFSRWLPKSRGHKQRVLYYGCRDQTDCMYMDEIKSTVDHYLIACSRMPTKQTYVMDLLRQDQKRIQQLVQAGARIHVCGSQAMAVQVRYTLEEILDDCSRLVETGKYVQDVF